MVTSERMLDLKYGYRRENEVDYEMEWGSKEKKCGFPHTKWCVRGGGRFSKVDFFTKCPFRAKRSLLTISIPVCGASHALPYYGIFFLAIDS